MSDFKTLPEGFTGIWIPSELYLHKSLNGSDRELLGALCSFHKSGSKYTSITYLSDLLGLDKSSVRKRVTKLEESGFLVRDNRNHKTGKSNLISPTPKCYGFESEDSAPVVVKKPVKASNSKDLKGGQAISPAPAKSPRGGQAISPADNKLNNKITTTTTRAPSRKPSLLEFFKQVSTLLKGQDIPRSYIEGRALDFYERYQHPSSFEIADYIAIDWHKKQARHLRKVSPDTKKVS